MTATSSIRPNGDAIKHFGAVVIGAGISGLSTAYWLRQRGVAVAVLERERHIGGTMRTIRDDGWLIETGPNNALETTPLFDELFSALGILDERVYANDSSDKRYILRGGSLHELPMSARAFLQTRLWSTAGKVRLFKEPFIGRAPGEESIAAFVERRLGREFLDYAINPFVAGVYAGNPEDLSVRAAFPKLYALEHRYGGLVKGMIKGRKERRRRAEKAKNRAKLFSFTGGMETFPAAAARALGNAVTTGAIVERIVPGRSDQGPVYTISYTSSGQRAILQTRAVILAVPAYAAAAIIRPIDPATADILAAIYYPPVEEVFLGFQRNRIKRPLDGFGFLIPAKERRKILGTIWSSAIFEGRAPHEYEAMTTFVGGSRQPELCALDDGDVLSTVITELGSIIGIEGTPARQRIIRWEKAIPQYTLGYGNVLGRMDRFEDNFRGAFLCGNFRGGIAVGDCVKSAHATAERVAEYLGGRYRPYERGESTP